MKITFAPRGILQIDDARIIYRNFSGESSKFNREGDRNFAVRFDLDNLTAVTFDGMTIYGQDVIDELAKEGWNLKIKPPRDEDEATFITLAVKVKFNDRGPVAYLKSGGNLVKLDEESISCLDDVDIMGVDLDIRPYDWEVNGKQGRTAYLQSIHVVQQIDRFAARYADMGDEEKLPF